MRQQRMKSKKSITIFSFIAAILLVSGLSGQALAGSQDKVLVYIKTDSQEKTKRILTHLGIEKRFDLLDGWVSAEIPAIVKDKLANTRGIIIEDVSTFEIVKPPWCNDSSTHPACKDDDSGGGSSTRITPSDQTPWGIETIYGDSTIASTSGGAGIKVAVVDTGITTHPDFANKDVNGDGTADTKIAQCLDYTGKNVKNSCKDGNGHGTHVAGTIAANAGTDNLGIYGVAPQATLLIYKVCNNGGTCSGDAIASAIIKATDDGANIISISLGGSSLSTAEKNAIDYAVSNGVLVVAAAGNSGPSIDSINYPAAYHKVVAVAALQQNGNELKVPDFSSRGLDVLSFDESTDRLVEVAAPGVSIESTWKDGGYKTISGTSMATPHISGLAAKIWSQGQADVNGDGVTTSQELRDWLHNSAANFDITLGQHARVGYDPAAGIGLPQIP